MNRLDTLAPETDEFGTPHFLEEAYGTEHDQLEPWRHINVARRERTISLAAGAAMIGLGLLRGRLSGLALAGLGAFVLKRGIDGHCMAYEALGINTAEDDQPDPTALYERGVKIQEAVTVNRPAQELYDYWHNFENHPRFMPNVESVRADDGMRSLWRIKGPAGVIVEYEAETINDEPGRLIAWRSVGGADIQHAGSVRFLDAPAGRGTEVHFNVEYLPPAGYVGKFGAKLLRLIGKAPRNDVREGLRNFKRLMETGELPKADGQARGK